MWEAIWYLFIIGWGRVSGGWGGVRQFRSADSEAGFVLVDTLTAVTVISLVVAVCLVTVNVSGANARNAQTVTQARLLLTSLMETTPRSLGVYHGIQGDMSYEVNVTEAALNDVHLCLLDAAVTPRKKGRIYHLSGTRWCARAPA